jgi:hypothetical protein
MSDLVSGVSKVIRDINPHSARSAACMSACFDLTHQCADFMRLTFADFSQHIPEFGFHPHAGSAALGNDISVD